MTAPVPARKGGEGEGNAGGGGNGIQPGGDGRREGVEWEGRIRGKERGFAGQGAKVVGDVQAAFGGRVLIGGHMAPSGAAGAGQPRLAESRIEHMFVFGKRMGDANRAARPRTAWLPVPSLFTGRLRRRYVVSPSGEWGPVPSGRVRPGCR